MFGHSVVGDPNSAFSGGPIGIYGSGTEAFLGVTSLVPEPTSALLVLAALAGVMPVISRRRTAV